MLVSGDMNGEALLDRYRELGGPDQSGSDAVFLAEVVAPILGFLRRLGDAVDELLGVLERDLRARGAVRPLVSVLGARSMAKYSRAFPATVSAGTEAILLAESNGFASWPVRGWRARPVLRRGRRSRASASAPPRCSVTCPSRTPCPRPVWARLPCTGSPRGASTTPTSTSGRCSR